MKEWKLEDLRDKMQDLDICMFTTTGKDGELISRPMSNNGDVEYDGNSFFFSYEDSNIVQELKENDDTNLSFQGKGKLYLSISGKSIIIKNKAKMKEHWVDSLDTWFKEGLETPGVVMIHVKADKIKYWQNNDGGEIKV